MQTQSAKTVAHLFIIAKSALFLSSQHYFVKSIFVESALFLYVTLTASTNFCMLFPFLCTERVSVVRCEMTLESWSRRVLCVA